MLLYFLLQFPVTAILCSELDVGTDLNHPNNIISKGVIHKDWSPLTASNVYSPAESEFYIYVKGFDLLGPKFEIQEFHHEDELADQWLFMNISVDREIDGVLKDYRAFKIIQECIERPGDVSIKANITFKAQSCEPITFAWIKECGETGQLRTGLQIGLSPGSKEVVENGLVSEKFDRNLQDDVFRVPVKVKEVVFYVWFSEMPVKTFFKTPFVVTDEEVMVPKLRGSMMKASWIQSGVLEIKVEFNCIGRESEGEEVMLVIELPYFWDLEIHFLKDCEDKRKEAKVVLIVLTALGMVFLVVGMWMHVSGKMEKANEWVSEVKERAMEMGLRYFIMIRVRFREYRSREKIKEDIHTLYGTM